MAGGVKKTFDAITGGSGNWGEANRQRLLWTGRAEAKRTAARVSALEANQQVLKNASENLRELENNEAVQAITKMDKAALLNPLNVKNVTVTQVQAGTSKKDILFAQRLSVKNTKLLEQFTKATQDIAKNTKAITDQDTDIKKSSSSGSFGKKRATGKNAAGAGAGLSLSGATKKPSDTDGTFMNMIKEFWNQFKYQVAGGLAVAALGIMGTVTGLGVKGGFKKAFKNYKLDKANEKKLKAIKAEKKAEAKAKKDADKKTKTKTKTKPETKKTKPKSKLKTSVTKYTKKVTTGVSRAAKASKLGMMKLVNKQAVAKILKKILSRGALVLMAASPFSAILAGVFTAELLYDFVTWGAVQMGILNQEDVDKFEEWVVNTVKGAYQKIEKKGIQALDNAKEFLSDQSKKDYSVNKQNRKNKRYAQRIDKLLLDIEEQLKIENMKTNDLARLYKLRANLLKTSTKWSEMNGGADYGYTQLRTWTGSSKYFFFVQQIKAAKNQEERVKAEVSFQKSANVSNAGISNFANFATNPNYKNTAEVAFSGFGGPLGGSAVTHVGGKYDTRSYLGTGSVRVGIGWVTYPNGMTKRGGSKSWRNNNPGNITGMGGKLLFGAIGIAVSNTGDRGDRAQLVFSSTKDGFNAMRALIAKRYGTGPINVSFRKYQTDMVSFSNKLKDLWKHGIDHTKSFNSLTTNQKQLFLEIWAKWEGYKIGKITQGGTVVKNMFSNINGSNIAPGGAYTPGVGGSYSSPDSSLPRVQANITVKPYDGPQNIDMDPNKVFIRSGSAASKEGWDGLEQNFKIRVLMLGAEFLHQTGKKMRLMSAYRSIAHQTILWNNSAKDGKKVARPGGSMHNYGLAVDIDMRGRSSNQVDLAVQMGLLKKYNLYRPMSYEKWHIEPVETKGKRGRGKEVIVAETSSNIGVIPPASGVDNIRTGATSVKTPSTLQNMQTPAKKQEVIVGQLKDASVEALETSKQALANSRAPNESKEDFKIPSWNDIAILDANIDKGL